MKGLYENVNKTYVFVSRHGRSLAAERHYSMKMMMMMTMMMMIIIIIIIIIIQ
jgi:hypothetical protein